MDEREFIIQKVKAYKQLVDTSFPVAIDGCWLYGSYAKGTQKKYSDIAKPPPGFPLSRE